MPRNTITSFALIAMVAGALAACSSSPTASPDASAIDARLLDERGRPVDQLLGDGPAHERDVNPGDGPLLGDGPAPGCTPGATRCAGTLAEELCAKQGGQTSWTQTPCASGQTCLKDHCVAACVDLCFYGEEQSVGGQTQTCRLFSEDSSAFSDLGVETHDRMRNYLSWIRRHHLANGYIADAYFSDASHTDKLHYFGTVDAGEWTGAYLAAESLRLMATRSPDAERSVQATVDRMCELFEVTNITAHQPGYMARFWAPLGENPLWDDIYDPQNPTHKTLTYQGKQIFYQGHTSRDMYQGALMGLGLAYDALQSPAHRKRIREVMLTLASELVKERKAVPVKVVWGSTEYPVPLLADLEHVVLVPDDMYNDQVFVRIGTEEDPNDWGSSELHGVREFFPSFTPVLKQLLNQIPLIGPPAAAMLPPINRPGSAVSLAYFLRLALHVSADVDPADPDFAAIQQQRALIEAHYMAKKGEIIPVIKEWTYHHTANCWASYFGITIAYHPSFGLARLETDPDYKDAAQHIILQRLWPVVKEHKNLYFTFLTAGQTPTGSVTPTEISAAVDQLNQIRPPPKTRGWIDNSGMYPADPACQSGSEGTPMTTVAVDLANRIPVDFIWQHHPFRLQTWQPMDNFVMAGVDYLIAYWLARYQNFLADDADGTCLRFAP